MKEHLVTVDPVYFSLGVQLHNKRTEEEESLLKTALVLQQMLITEFLIRWIWA